MLLREVMTRGIEEVPPEATLKDAARKMRELDIGVLPVCEDEHKVIGMITDRDIAVRAVALGRDPNSTKVREAMSSDLIFCHDTDSVEAAAKLMEEKQIRRLPILDKTQHLCGIVSLGDLATRDREEHISEEVLEKVSQPKQTHA